MHLAEEVAGHTRCGSTGHTFHIPWIHILVDSVNPASLLFDVV